MSDKEYSAPTLLVHGKAVELTASGSNGPSESNDADNSVTEPGFKSNPGRGQGGGRK